MSKIVVCSGILIDDLNRVLLIKRKFNKKDLPNYWSFPEGKQEEGEDIKETVIREVKEEVGLDFVVTKQFSEEEGGNKNNYFYKFLGKYSGDIIIQDKECDGYGWFLYEETEQLLTYSKIREALKKLYNENLMK